MMATTNIDGYHPVGTPHAYANRKWGNLNAAKPHSMGEGYVLDDLRADKLQKGWDFRASTWNIDSLTGRAGELVEALAQRII